MKTFLIKCAVYILLTTTIVVLSILTPVIYINSKPQYYTVDQSINKLALGDSHFLSAISTDINPSIANISLSADAYFYSFLKLKKFIAHNPQIDTIVLAYGFHSLSDKTEKRWTEDPTFVKTKTQKLFALMALSDYGTAFAKSPIDVMKGTVISPKKTVPAFIKALKGDGNYKDLNLGRFKKLNHKKLQSNIDKINGDTVKIDFIEAHYQKEYLLKIIEYCNKHKKKVILINTPIHQFIYEKLKDERTHYYKFYNEHLSNHILLDYANIKYPDSLYADLTHLNGKGANEFSLMLKKDLKKLSSKN